MVRVAVGGTFDPLHDGHLSLLRRAFELGRGGKVVIGLTSDEMARKTRDRPVRDFQSRLRKLKEVLQRELGEEEFSVIKIHDQCGSSLYEDFDYIVVSTETLPMAEKINRLREKRGMKPIKISVIECQMAQDEIRISSTRISEGKIDRHGKVLKSY
jgi:pantetheine-phosphate adenylyltransferase